MNKILASFKMAFPETCNFNNPNLVNVGPQNTQGGLQNFHKLTTMRKRNF